MTPEFDAVIVGAGFGGMGAAIALQELGYRNLTILDREDDLGGTWHVNHYPGLAVDIASVTYSYSFAPNPNWTRLFAPGAELKRYAEHIADSYDLRRAMRFGILVERAEWDDDAQFWRVVTATGESITGRFLVTATGFLSQPHTPDFAGIDTFAGTILHTTRWDDDHDVAGERVAVIGTGATAVQLIPELAERARHLTVFQRTPIWVVPKIDFPIPAPVRRLFARIPTTQKAARSVNNALLEALMIVGVLHFRQAKPMNSAAALLAKAHLRLSVRDRATRRALTPHYSFGCKRPTFSNKYFRTFNRKDTDLQTSPIERFDADGIVTADGTHTPVDTLVLATGFNLWDVNFPALTIVGREGRDLGQWWRDNRFQAYEGITVSRFPNLLSLNSPYSYSGLSYFTTIESQMGHMRRLLGELHRRGAASFEVTDEANDAFLAYVTRRLDDSVFYRGQCSTARSYYFNQHGEAALLRPTSTSSSFRAASSFPLNDYEFGESTHAG
ncbi:flavin-containing monooxygenase [Williamsia deligens]|uniref:Flavin-containing monooxygenase n=1 Tax=Williamsia deligens TaxID=321325 RepID=A0ABW3G877_9NOCA|nr:NAD(P)/FAD-dependent oxidoreductase [Williamsia deligens]MCP2193390.1 putative flavoprotein CzcO associated with the cation diffusion facilitator CzcD [Williamsia deligens]